MSLYFDYNATTPLDQSVLNVINNALENAWGNPSSSSSAGQLAKAVIQDAREKVAEMINANSSDDIIFTSGGTESNNLVFHTVLHDYSLSDASVLPHVIISAIEHPATIFPLEHLAAANRCTLTLLPILTTGDVDPEEVRRQLRPETVLVSVMLANNETGVVNDLKRIVEVVKEWQNEKVDGENISKEARKRRIFVHTDAAQAIGKIEVDVQELGVDYLTVVGHKFYGPRIGALYVCHPGTDTPVHPMFFGGGQERGFRPGTENTGMIAGLGEASRLVTTRLPVLTAHYSRLISYFESQIRSLAPSGFGAVIHGEGAPRISNTCNVSVVCLADDRGTIEDGSGTTEGAVSATTLVNRLLAKGVTVGKGAACHTGVDGPSATLLAMQISPAVARSAIRFSVGRETTVEDVERVATMIWDTVFEILNDAGAGAGAEIE
ncbi:hypothetical protein BC937DRAFT_94998 [Endogone sp. FLAS-F59071]|nr:hypothetical protein BC937DRAFT_94998 [Endogone sp. FLAS-F59071]|eukprot:RUS20527.1 hypothetical protein BC937DRAFT_94998 [Endogone sp. FLAS-F59071]